MTGPIVDGDPGDGSPGGVGRGGGGAGDGVVVRTTLWARIAVTLWALVLVVSAVTGGGDPSIGARAVVVVVGLGGLAMAFRPRLVVRDGMVDLQGVVVRRTFPVDEVESVVLAGKHRVIVRRPEADPLGMSASALNNDIFVPLLMSARTVAAAIGVPGPPRLFRR